MKYIACLEPDNEEILNGCSCIMTIGELYRAIIDTEATEVEVRKDFAEEFFTPSGLSHFVEDAQNLNPKIVINVDGVLSLFNEDAVKELMTLKTPEELLYALEKKPKEIIDTIQMLGNEYLATSYETLVANNKVATLHLQNATLQSKLRSVQDEKRALIELKNDYESKFNTLVSRINFKYNKAINPDTMFQVTGNKYDKILYIKEITRVHYTDTLVYYLQELLKTLYNVPVRLVVIEPPYAYGRAAMYPNCKPHFDLLYSDVYKEDIFMAGLQPELMQDILRNASSVNYLIILDRSGYAVPHVRGDNVEIVYCVSDSKDVTDSTIPADRIISYSEVTMNIPFIPGFDFLSVEEKMKKYSSMKIVKKLIELIERR